MLFLCKTERFCLTVLVLFFLGFSSLRSDEALQLDPDSVLDLESMKPKGTWYETVVPDTLDLASRADLSVNVLTNNIEPNKYYGVYLGFRYAVDPPQRIDLTWNITPKHTRTLPMLRTMTGSQYNLDVEYRMMHALMSQIREDGQIYYPFDGAGPPKGTSYPQTNALVAFSMINFWGRDDNPVWLKWLDLVSRGLRESSIQIEDRAFYPMQSGIDTEGKWHFMHHDRPLEIPYTPPDEPTSDQQGLEGAAKSDQIRCMSALVKHFRLTGNKQSLQIARKISRFVLKPSMWEDTRKQGYPGHEHGITRFSRGVSTVNLFLNRASPWMDIDSYLPYEGRVDLHNKKAHTALVRIPSWLNRNTIRASLRQSKEGVHTENPIEPIWVGNYLMFSNLEKGATIQLLFPVPDATDQYTIAGQQYTVKFRGSTVVDITPRDPQPDKIPLFRKRSSKAGKARMRRVKRFVSERLIPLGTF